MNLSSNGNEIPTHEQNMHLKITLYYRANLYEREGAPCIFLFTDNSEHRIHVLINTETCICENKIGHPQTMGNGRKQLQLDIDQRTRGLKATNNQARMHAGREQINLCMLQQQHNKRPLRRRGKKRLQHRKLIKGRRST